MRVFLGLAAGEVLFAEVLVTPTGVSKGCGSVKRIFIGVCASLLICSIVEFASQEDAQRSIRELSETPLLGRPIFIREVNRSSLSSVCVVEVLEKLGPGNRSTFWCHPCAW